VSTTSARSSLWLDRTVASITAHLDTAPLARDVKIGVVVIGGGIAGLTTALTLVEQGADVTVLEAGEIAGGVTACTTAKASALQGTVYSTIRSKHDEATAATYAEASSAAVERIAGLIATYGIDCDAGRRTAYTYAADASERDAIDQEADAAAAAGLAVDPAGTPDLPYDIAGAVGLAGQLELHPVRYVRGLAAAFVQQGGTIHEHARAVGVHEGRGGVEVRTQGGHTVRADHAVVATHYPVFDRGLYFALLEAKRSYCIAARLRSGTPPRGLAISAGEPTRSVRSYGALLVVGGEGHAAGAATAIPDRYANLEAFARRHWDVDEVTHRWSAQDPVPYDHLPMIGAYHPATHRLWVTTGYMKWGITSATFGASMLADLIGGQANPWAATFAPHRISLRSTPRIAALGAKFSSDFALDRARALAPADVGPGEGRVVRRGRRQVALYRDADGTAHALSARCTHLGCLVRFNAAETSWDCPCHGSRFGIDGAVLEGPAVKPLPRCDADADAGADA
jgi:glycine/D-amino acid oxidase-like deaminating enzyme/nitrite reductase/ring-hydroxylating ferredoxin subunit